jgi:hypothetical protein
MTRHKASPETMARLCEAALPIADALGGTRDIHHEIAFMKAANQYRAETTPQLRTRAEADAEIAMVVRSFQPLPSVKHGAVWEIRGVFPERLMKLCSEPTAPEPAFDPAEWVKRQDPKQVAAEYLAAPEPAPEGATEPEPWGRP